MTVTNLSTANTNLMQQVANLTCNMTDKDRELSALKLSIDKLTNQQQKISEEQATQATMTPRNSNQNAGSGRRNNSTGCGSGTNSSRMQPNAGGISIEYCHSCGVTKNHGSCTCMAPKLGHQVGATFQNMIGGSTQGMHM
eukprot:11478876-Ditylum_brightwellii.AAC.1